MSSPKDSFTRVPNALIQWMAANRIPGEAMQVLTVIVRKTYGFHKKSDKIPLSQFADTTGMKRPNVCRAIKKLLEIGIVETCGVKDDIRAITEYRITIPELETDSVGIDNAGGISIDNDGINPETTPSIKSDNDLVSKVITDSISIDNKLVSELIHSKERKKLSKENTKESAPAQKPFSDFDSFWSLYPRKEAKTKAKTKYEAIIKNREATHIEIIDGVRNYLNHIEDAEIEPKFIKQPTTWLNGGCWTDTFATAKKRTLHWWEDDSIIPLPSPEELQIAENEHWNNLTPEQRQAELDNRAYLKQLSEERKRKAASQP